MIRETRESDLKAVFRLIHCAFSSKAESDLAKQSIADQAVLVNLVVEPSVDIIVGNIIVSKVTMEPGRGLFCGGVAPVSVLPDHQSSGVGSLLMEAAIQKCDEIGIDVLFLLGGPNYYKRFGFNVSKLESDYSAEYFQELELTKGCLVNLKSTVTYADAFLGL